MLTSCPTRPLGLDSVEIWNVLQYSAKEISLQPKEYHVKSQDLEYYRGITFKFRGIIILLPLVQLEKWRVILGS